MNILSTKQVVIRIAGVISLAEFSIMLVLGIIPDRLGAYIEAILDVTALVVLTTPLIYLWVIRPFVMARDEAFAKISELAHLDPLTHLANRRLLLEHLQKAIASNIRHKIYGAVLILDLDEFKPINDVHGHDAGDAVLIEVSRRIQAITRSEDTVGRLGGDEFVVLLNQLDKDAQVAYNKAQQIAGKLVEQLSKPYKLLGKELQVGVSIGIRMLGFEAVGTDEALRVADKALYRAKQAGKGCVVFYED